MLDGGSKALGASAARNVPLLLSEDEPSAVTISNGQGTAPYLIVCDHAANRMPKSLKKLGMDPKGLAAHVAWDIGALTIARRLSDALAAPLIFSSYSRLVCDLNRYPHDPAFVPAQSDGIPVPGNIDLTPAVRYRRFDELFVPYHKAIADRLDAFEACGVIPALLSIHTCTDRLDGDWRPWPISLSSARDRRITETLITDLRATDLGPIGDNEPYSVDIGIDFTVCEHAMRRGLAYLQVEFRQDLVGNDKDAVEWADRFLPSLSHALQGPGVHERQFNERLPFVTNQ